MAGSFSLKPVQGSSVRWEGVWAPKAVQGDSYTSKVFRGEKPKGWQAHDEYSLNASEIAYLASRFQGLPVCLNHDTSKRIGTVVKAWVDKDGVGRCCLEIDPTLSGQWLDGKVATGEYRALSATHLVGHGLLEAVEISLCKEPARPGAKVTTRIIDGQEALMVAASRMGKGNPSASNATVVQTTLPLAAPMQQPQQAAAPQGYPPYAPHFTYGYPPPMMPPQMPLPPVPPVQGQAQQPPAAQAQAPAVAADNKQPAAAADTPVLGKRKAGGDSGPPKQKAEAMDEVEEDEENLPGEDAPQKAINEKAADLLTKRGALSKREQEWLMKRLVNLTADSMKVNALEKERKELVETMATTVEASLKEHFGEAAAQLCAKLPQSSLGTLHRMITASTTAQKKKEEPIDESIHQLKSRLLKLDSTVAQQDLAMQSSQPGYYQPPAQQQQQQQQQQPAPQGYQHPPPMVFNPQTGQWQFTGFPPQPQYAQPPPPPHQPQQPPPQQQPQQTQAVPMQTNVAQPQHPPQQQQQQQMPPGYAPYGYPVPYGYPHAPGGPQQVQASARDPFAMVGLADARESLMRSFTDATIPHNTDREGKTHSVVNFSPAAEK